MEAAESTRSLLPVLATLTGSEVLVVPMSWSPKSREEGETAACGDLLGPLVPSLMAQPVGNNPRIMMMSPLAAEPNRKKPVNEQEPVCLRLARRAFTRLKSFAIRMPCAIVSLSMNGLPFWYRPQGTLSANRKTSGGKD